MSSILRRRDYEPPLPDSTICPFADVENDVRTRAQCEEVNCHSLIVCFMANTGPIIGNVVNEDHLERPLTSDRAYHGQTPPDAV